MDYWRLQAGPFLYAHRGAGVECPENTLAAFETALAEGADVLELDVHMSRDGELVVAHDPTGARTAGVPRELRHSTLAQIRTWDVGRDPAHPARIPTLREVLERFADTPLNVDLKQGDPDMTRAILDLVAEYDAHERVLLTSFETEVIARIRRAHYPGPTGLCRRDAFLAVLAPAAWLRRRPLPGVRLQVPPRHGPLDLARGGLIRKLHGLGICVDYWVVNDPAEAERLLALGADGIVTDSPRALAPLFARSPQTAGWRARHPAHASGGTGPRP